MPEGAFQERMQQYRAAVELTAIDARRAEGARVADHEQERTASATVTSLLDRLFDGSLRQNGMAA